MVFGMIMSLQKAVSKSFENFVEWKIGSEYDFDVDSLTQNLM